MGREVHKNVVLYVPLTQALISKTPPLLGCWFSSALCLVPRTAAGRPTNLPSNEVHSRHVMHPPRPCFPCFRMGGRRRRSGRSGPDRIENQGADRLRGHSDTPRVPGGALGRPPAHALQGGGEVLARTIGGFTRPVSPHFAPHLREEAATNTTAATTTAMLNMAVASSRRLPRRSHGRTATTRTPHDVP
jgi:hypothetical protein